MIRINLGNVGKIRNILAKLKVVILRYEKYVK
jgi:hypothetical protein